MKHPKSRDSIQGVVLGDCVQQMAKMPPECVHLAFADPPFNIGHDYDIYQDKREAGDYLAWSDEWLRGVYRVLRNDGTFWLAIGDEYAAELKVLAQSIGFRARSWIVWYYTFGVNCSNKFTRSHAHLLYFIKGPTFVFNEASPANRIPSARQLVYHDKRANPRGRLPDDTWILRPQEFAECFTIHEDTWHIPRVAGTFKEREGFHGCQMPEQVLGRIIRTCSHPGDLVLDPFVGSGTTLAVAKKLGRKWHGFELSAMYTNHARIRLSEIKEGDPLSGSPGPTMENQQ